MTAFDDATLVQRRSARLGALLAQTDAPIPALSLPAHLVLRPRPVWVPWQLAAALVLLIGGAAGVPPVRAWIVGAARSVWVHIAGEPAVVPATDSARASKPQPTSAGAVSFVSDDPLTIRISSRQSPGGTLILEAAAGNQVTASLVGRSDAAELLVGPDLLRIMNRQSSAATYLIGVPASISRVMVQVARERPLVVVMADSGRTTVNLGVRTTAPGTLKQ